MYICRYTSIYVCTYVCMHVCISLHICIYAYMYVCMYPIFKSQAVQARPLNTVPHLHRGGGLKSRQIWQVEIETLYSCKWNWKFYYSFTTLTSAHLIQKYSLTLLLHVPASFTTSSWNSVQRNVVGVMNEQFSQDAQNKQCQNGNSGINSRSWLADWSSNHFHLESGRLGVRFSARAMTVLFEAL